MAEEYPVAVARAHFAKRGVRPLRRECLTPQEQRRVTVRRWLLLRILAGR